MQVTDRVNDFGSTFSNLIRGTDHVTSIDSASGHPETESARVVVSPVGSLYVRCSAKFAPPDHEGVFQHAALGQVGQESGQGLVGGLAVGL